VGGGKGQQRDDANLPELECRTTGLTLQLKELKGGKNAMEGSRGNLSYGKRRSWACWKGRGLKKRKLYNFFEERIHIRSVSEKKSCCSFLIRRRPLIIITRFKGTKEPTIHCGAEVKEYHYWRGIALTWYLPNGGKEVTRDMRDGDFCKSNKVVHKQRETSSQSNSLKMNNGGNKVFA